VTRAVTRHPKGGVESGWGKKTRLQNGGVNLKSQLSNRTGAQGVKKSGFKTDIAESISNIKSHTD
jgi:hypothetical protein